MRVTSMHSGQTRLQERMGMGMGCRKKRVIFWLGGLGRYSAYLVILFDMAAKDRFVVGVSEGMG